MSWPVIILYKPRQGMHREQTVLVILPGLLLLWNTCYALYKVLGSSLPDLTHQP